MQKHAKLLIIGAGGHGKVVADVAVAMRCYNEIAFLDDVQPVRKWEYPWLGGCDSADSFVGAYDFFVAIGNGRIRQRWMEQLRNMQANISTLIHPSVILGTNVTVADGSVLMPGVIVNADAKIGTGVIVNTAASVDHDCAIGDYCHIAVGAHVCGTVFVGEQTWIGAGATVGNNVEIAPFCTIGAGGVVVKSILESGTYVGVPVRKVK